MKLHVLSDLHLEFNPFKIPDVGADVTILAGDIGVDTKGVEFAKKIKTPVIYVLGNHEFYHRTFPDVTEWCKRSAKGSNVHVLENEEVVIDGVRFLGCTLWTDFLLWGSKHRYDSMESVKAYLNDYHIVYGPHGILTPTDTLDQHDKSVKWMNGIDWFGEYCGKTVLVTHHAPSMRSCPERFKNDLTTSGFISDMERFMGPHVPFWIHGHTHHSVDYTINGTRVVSNQKGYSDWTTQHGKFKPDFVVEI